jgi:hypothetical protein
MVSRGCWKFPLVLVITLVVGSEPLGAQEAIAPRGLVAMPRDVRPGARDADDDDSDEEDREEADTPQAPDQMISDSVFAHWVFGMEDARDARRRLKEVLGTRVDEVETTFRVTPAQRRKLELAGRGDIERFFDHVAEKRKELDLLQVDEHKTRRFVITELIPLRSRIRQGPFGEGSLFAKTLNKMLNDRQLARKSTSG